MAGDVEQLVVQLEARVTDFEKQMKKAGAVANSNFASIRKGAKSVSASMASDITTGAVRMNSALASSSVHLGDVGKAAMLSRMQFMELGHSARATFDILAAGGTPLRALELEGAQVVQALAMGRGGIGGAIKAIGGAVLGLATPINLAIAAVAALGIGAVAWLTHENSATVDATAALEAHKKWLDQILAGYDEAKKAADAYLAAVNKLPEAAVASDLNAKMKPALDNLQNALAALRHYQDELTLDLTNGAQQFGAGNVADIQHLVDVVKEAGLSANSTKGQFDALVTSLTQIKNGTDQYGAMTAFLAGKMLDLVENADKAAAAVGSVDTALNSLPSSVTVQIGVEMKGFNDARQKLLSLVPDQRDEYQRARDNAKIDYNQALGSAPDAIMRQAVTGDYNKVLAGIDAAEKAAQAKKGNASAESAAARQAKQIDSVTESLKRQFAALGMTSRQQAEQNALARAGIDANSKYASGIITLADKLYDAKTAQQALTDAEHLFADTAVSGLEGVLKGTESLTDALGDLLSTLADAVLKAALLGEGPLAGILGDAPAQSGGVGGLFGSIFSGLGSLFHFANGTDFAPGGLSLVGERGPELVNLPRGAQVIPAPQTAAMLRGANSAPITFAPVTTINGSGLSEDQLARVMAANNADLLARFNAQFVPAVQRVMGQHPSMAGQRAVHFR